MADVKGVGKKYQIKEVSSGYANNFLLPQKKAVLATPHTEMQLRRQEAEFSSKQDALAKSLEESIAKLNESGVVLSAKVNEQGGLYQSLHADAIAIAANKATGVVIDNPEAVFGKVTLKEAGDRELSLPNGSTLKVTVVAE